MVGTLIEGPQRDGNEPGSDDGGRSAPGTASNAPRIDRIAHSPEMDIPGDEAIGTFVDVQRADQHGPRCTKSLDTRSIGCGGGMTQAQFRIRRRRQVRDIEQVLGRKRYVDQLACVLTNGNAPVYRRRPIQGGFFTNAGAAPEMMIASHNARDRCPSCGNRVASTGTDCTTKGCCRVDIVSEADKRYTNRVFQDG